MKPLFLAIAIGLLLHGCVSFKTPATAMYPTSDLTATAVLPLEQNVVPSPTISSPLESDGDEYCRPPYAVLPVGDDNDISEDEIVHELLRVWLRRYVSSDAPHACRIDGFTIDNVYFDLEILSRPLEPRGDFMRLVDFSVKPVQTPNDWMSFSGELDQENWLRLRHAVAVFETGEGYTLVFAYP